MGFKAAISKWAEDNPIGAKILAQQAEIARLQAEVVELKLQLGMCDHSLHAAWNDAIEAAANEAANWWAYLHDDQDRDGPIAESIRAIKRT